MNEDEYRENEKVLYKTRCKLSLPHKEPEEADCLVTETHVVIDAKEEPIQIPLCRIKKCDVWHPISYSAYSVRDSGPLRSDVTLTLSDDVGKKQELSFKMAITDLQSFKRVIDQQIIEEEETGFWEKRFGDTILGAAIKWQKEKQLSKWRGIVDKVCNGLCIIGVDAQVAEQRRLEEHFVGNPSPFYPVKCLGLIEVNREPIRWVNVIRRKVGSQSGTYFEYRNLYLVPASSVPTLDLPTDTLVAWSIRKKSMPLIGRVIGVCWEGRFQDNLIGRLNEDAFLNDSIVRLGIDIEIRSHARQRCWSINREYSEKLPEASREEWDCYETIARHLLEHSQRTHEHGSDIVTDSK